jgi:hypothetical protein
VEVNDFDENVISLAGFPKSSRDADHKIMSHGVEVDIFGLEALK